MKEEKLPVTKRDKDDPDADIDDVFANAIFNDEFARAGYYASILEGLLHHEKFCEFIKNNYIIFNCMHHESGQLAVGLVEKDENETIEQTRDRAKKQAEKIAKEAEKIAATSGEAVEDERE